LDSDILEVSYRYKTRGEAWIMTRTDVIRQFPLPEHLTRVYVPESIMWHQIARKYKMRFVNEHLRIYYQGPSNGDQLSRHTVQKRVPARDLYARGLVADLDWFWHNPTHFNRKALQYSILCSLAQDTLPVQLGRLPSAGARALWMGAILPGYLLAQRAQWRNGKIG
jgi:hypothetical protein